MVINLCIDFISVCLAIGKRTEWEGEAIDKEDKLKRATTELNVYAKHVTELKGDRRRAEEDTEEKQKEVEASTKESHKAMVELDVLVNQLDSSL